MNKNRLRNNILMGASGLVLMSTVQADTPVWTFDSVPGFLPSVTVGTTETATIKYTVINQSYKQHTLRMNPVQGITSSGCTLPLAYLQSCILTLSVDGSALKGDVLGGPVLCDQDNPNQCYHPGEKNSLAIRLTQQPPVQQYMVTSSTGANGSVSPLGTQTANSGTTLTFTAIPDVGYGVNQWLLDGSLVQMGGTSYQLTNLAANHSVNVSFGTVTLTPGISTLALSVNCLPSSSCATMQNAALTGNPRQITIQNTGSAPATNVSASMSGQPLGTSITSNTCNGTLNAGASCIITVTPGAVASSNASSTPCTSGTRPVPGVVTITADGGLTSHVNAYVLSYGCIYQGGFIYSVDDTTLNAASIGGKTAALMDTYPGRPFPIITGTPNWGGYGIDIGSNLYETSPQGANNGSANSAAIISALTTNYSNPPYSGSSPVPLSNYAAGLCSMLSVDSSGASSCTAPNTCYTDWYLPATCEQGPVVPLCTAGSTSIQKQLFENALIPGATLGLVNNAYYWSSTESSINPASYGRLENFSTGGSNQGPEFKDSQLGVRCSRILTH